MANLRVLAVGNSVVWGQGLNHSNKFASLLYSELTGIAWPNEDLLARSGAIIGLDKHGSPISTSDVPDRDARHEVPFNFPTILEQVGSVGDLEAKDVEVLILDGGINDVDVETILAKTLLSPETELEGPIRQHCFVDMDVLLKEARGRFPHAVILVLGYYPILSTKSNLNEVTVFLALKLLPFGILSEVVAKKAVRNALYFHRRQLHWLRRAVTEANSDRGLRGPGILFVHPAFSASNSVAAGDPFLFQPKRPSNILEWVKDVNQAIISSKKDRLPELLLQVEPEDPVAPKRRSACNIVYADDWGQRMKCRVASIGHPNEKGARRYADAILERFKRHQRLSVKDHVLRLTNEASPISVRKALERYGLRPQDGLRACMQHMFVDCIEVVIKTKNEDYAGTDHSVFLQVGDGWRWQLNESIFDLEFTNEFEKGRTGTYTIDPVMDSSRGPMHLSEIKEISLIKGKSLLPGGDWKPGSIVVRINGLEVFQSAINAELTNTSPIWVATDPGYPRK